MGLEKRGNGVYYYKKRRIGNRVVSEYCGAGEIGRLMQLLDRERRGEARLEKELLKRSFEKEKYRQSELDEAIDTFCLNAKAFEDALFLINDYHVHSRQWRKKRNDNKDETEET